MPPRVRMCASSVRLVPATRYKSLGIWSGDPHLPPANYDRFRASLISSGFVNPGTNHEVAMDNSLADTAIAEDPPPLE